MITLRWIVYKNIKDSFFDSFFFTDCEEEEDEGEDTDAAVAALDLFRLIWLNSRLRCSAADLDLRSDSPPV